MSAYRRTLLALAVLPIALPLSASATSLKICLDDLDKYPPSEVAQTYAARLKTEKLPREEAFWSNYCVGRAWLNAGELNKAEPALRTAAKLAKNAKERYGVQSFLGGVLTDMNRLDAAETAHHAALAAAREIGSASNQASELNNLGVLADNRNQLDKARSYYARSIDLQPDLAKKANVLNNMASLHNKSGHHELAADTLQSAIKIARQMEDKRKLQIFLLNLGNEYRNLRQWKECSTALDEGLALARANGDRYWEAYGLLYWGAAYRDDNQPAKAKEYLVAARDIFREIGAAGMVAQAETDLRGLK